MKQPRLGAAIALACLLTVGGFTALPILAVGIGASPPCGQIGEIADDGTPSILGPSALTVAELRAWWTSTGRGQPPRLGIAISDLIALYLSEGDAEGVRGDLALAQAVLETGYFTNSDTAINNFAGIAHYDGTASGSGFPDPIIGVRAQIQLLKKYALGNDASLANADVAPNAGASATTWGGLAGTWASDTNYWTSLSSVYESMRTYAGTNPGQLEPSAPTGASAMPSRRPGDQRRLRPATRTSLVRRASRVVHETPPRLPGRRHPGSGRHPAVRRHQRRRRRHPNQRQVRNRSRAQRRRRRAVHVLPRPARHAGGGDRRPRHGRAVRPRQRLHRQQHRTPPPLQQQQQLPRGQWR